MRDWQARENSARRKTGREYSAAGRKSILIDVRGAMEELIDKVRPFAIISGSFTILARQTERALSVNVEFSHCLSRQFICSQVDGF